MDQTTTTAPVKKKLGLWSLLAIGVGYTIGAGIVTVVGQAIAVTGYSAWLAYLAAIGWGLTIIIPFMFVTSTIVVRGGPYTVVQTLLGDRIGGVYACTLILSAINMSLFGISLGNYLNSVFPIINPKLAGIVILLLFYAVNLMGISFMAKWQSPMTLTLIVVLTAFGLYGATKASPAVFAVTSPEFLMNGSDGFIGAMSLLLFSCYAHYSLINYGVEAKKPKRDIPLAMFLSTIIIIIVYGLVTITASGILPIAEVANKPLTMVAKAILPNNLFFIIFMLGGPIMALTTTMNSAFAGHSRPAGRAAADGWLPPFFAKTNKYGAPVTILTIICAIGILPIIFGYDINSITRNLLLVSNANMIIFLLAVVQLPKKCPEQWAKSTLHVPNGLFYTIMVICGIGLLLSVAVQLKKLTVMKSVISIGVYATIAVYTQIRYNKGLVHIHPGTIE